MDSNAITLLKLQQMVKEQIKRSFTSRLWVVAEIGQMNIASTGHCYLELIERNEKTEYIAAKSSATIWRGALDGILRRFLNSTGSRLNVGMKILAYVEVSFHEIYGMSLNISDIDPSYTLGEIEMKRRATIKRLTDDGDMERNSEIVLPSLVQRIAIVSSEKAAGYGDFMDELLDNEYDYLFHTELFHAIMQGNDAENSILSALEQIYLRYDEFDAIVIIRGGGSTSDLSCFDSYNIAKMVAYSPLVVISGIGHDRDESIMDMVAAISVKTPTAAARFLIDKMLECENGLDELQNYILDIYREELDSQKEFVESASRELHSVVNGMVRERAVYFGRIEQKLHDTSKNLIFEADKRGDKAVELISSIVKSRLEARDRFINSRYMLLRSKSGELLGRESRKIEVEQLQIDNFNPSNIFAMGYSMAKAKGRVVKSIADVEKGEKMEIRVKDGVLVTTITDIKHG